MRQIVIMPGGFHPFHAGHAALYKSAVKAFNNADTYVAATNDTKTRPFPFAIKEKLAKLAGVADKHFVQVKSPFQPIEITGHYNPEEDVLIFVRSDKDRNESPKPGGTKKDGTPAYFQPWTGKNVQPFGKQAYIAYLPTVEFGPGITSASEIRDAWPKLDDRRKTAMVMSLYPVTQKNPKLAANVLKMLDMGMGNELAEAINKVEPISKSVPIQKTVIHPVKQHMHSPPEKKTTPAVVNHIKPRDTLKEFVPPSSDDGGGDNRSRRIRKLLEIAIQVAKEKNVDELGMIHAMNMIAGDDFFNTAVDGILPDITDKEYMFVLQSAYKTVKQGLAEGDVVPFKQPSKALTWKQVPKDILLLANDWLWAEYDNTGLDAVIDPNGFGNGTANELQYITAKLQQKGWTIDHNDENDGPDEYNLILTNKRGQTVLLSIEDAQTFSGWAKGTSQYDLEEAEKTAKVFHPQYVDVYFLEGSRREPILVNRKVPYHLIDKYLEVAIKKYNLQQGRFEFRNAEEDVAEGWKTKLGTAALTGAMALGSSGAHSADISSPTFNGMQTISHNDGSNTTKYNSGPLSMQLTKNKQGKTTSAQRNYQIGDTNVGVGTNAIGVNTLTATGDKADNLVGVGPSAERLKVSPDKIKAFQQGVKESSFKKSNVSKNQDYLEEK